MDLTLPSLSRTLIVNSSVKKVMKGYGDSMSGFWGFLDLLQTSGKLGRIEQHFFVCVCAHENNTEKMAKGTE